LVWQQTCIALFETDLEKTMIRRIMFLPLLCFITSAACASVALPGQEEAATETVTSTSTPLLNLDEIAQRTHTATLSPTPSETPTPTPTETILPASATFTPTLPEDTSTATLAPEITLTPTSEEEDAAGDNQIFAADIAEMPARFFIVQPGSPVGLPNWVHAEAGCDWMGVAGQVFNLQGEPELNLIIEAGGTLEGQDVIGLALTGLESVYGPGGYEMQLADHTIASEYEVWILIKSDSGEILSNPIYLQTFADCNQNLILLNLIEVEEMPDMEDVFLPIIHQSSDE
jgi:hypothetical protein